MPQSCDHLFYHDTTDRQTGLIGSCKRCPCSKNAQSCHLNSVHQVQCECKPGYFGELCTDDGT